MRRAPFVLVVLLGCVLAVAPAGSGARRAPVVRVVTVAPLRVAGSGFGSREQLRLTARLVGKSVTASIRASASGAFVYAFSASLAERGPCGRPVVNVGRADGSVVAVKLFGRMCSPQSSP